MTVVMSLVQCERNLNVDMGVCLVFLFVASQANKTGSSNAMELEGAKRSFNFLKNMGLPVSNFI